MKHRRAEGERAERTEFVSTSTVEKRAKHDAPPPASSPTWSYTESPSTLPGTACGDGTASGPLCDR